MDEPLGALDKQLREQMQYEIRHLHERLGITVVYVTHDQAEALTMSDRIAVFNDGAIQQLSTPDELYESPHWAVRTASRCVPAATCLAQALAAFVLMARRGHPVRVCIGVARGDGGRLEAHAWVESGGRIVFGGLADLGRYTTLPPLEANAL